MFGRNLNQILISPLLHCSGVFFRFFFARTNTHYWNLVHNKSQLRWAWLPLAISLVLLYWQGLTDVSVWVFQNCPHYFFIVIAFIVNKSVTHGISICKESPLFPFVKTKMFFFTWFWALKDIFSFEALIKVSQATINVKKQTIRMTDKWLVWLCYLWSSSVSNIANVRNDRSECFDRTILKIKAYLIKLQACEEALLDNNGFLCLQLTSANAKGQTRFQ